MATPQPELIHVGRGDLYIGVDVPTSGQVVPLIAGVPATGRFVGSTLAEAMWVYKPRSFDIRTQQSTGIQGYVVIEEELAWGCSGISTSLSANGLAMAPVELAASEELKSEWSEIPSVVHVPPEVLYYAVDQKVEDEKGNAEKNSDNS